MHNVDTFFHGVLNPKRDPHGTQGGQKMPVVPVEELVSRDFRMADDAHGIFTQDMALFHAFEHIQGDTDHKAVITRRSGLLSTIALKYPRP